MPEHVEPQPRAHPGRLRARSPRVRLHDATVALASAGVLTLLVLYAVAAPSTGLTATVGPIVPRPGSTAVVQGRIIEPDGGGLKGARVVVRRSGRPAGTAVSDDAGAFRIELSGRCSAYDISVRARALGSTVGTHARRNLCPGDALPIDIRVVTQGHFIWVPGPR
jgi:hypothetical protein